MHLMILGGTGCVGRALIDHLAAGSARVGVSVVSRTAIALPRTRRVLTGHFADLLATPSFRRHLATADAVVHLADGLSILQRRRYAYDLAESDRLIEQSAQLADAARTARVPLFIYMSSIKALSDEEDPRVLVETSEPRSTTLYGRSKLCLEDRLARVFLGSDTRCVILRTPVIYGPGAGGSLRRLLAHVDSPLPLPLGGLTNRRSVLCTRNLASACAAILRPFRSGPSGVFHIHDGPPLSTTDMVATLRHALRRPARLFPPTPLGAGTVRRIPALGPLARRLLGSLELSDTHFCRSFQWQPVRDTRTALAEMAVGYAAETGREQPAPLRISEAA
jgi:UDP-N-acetyl-alpha-D-quinovosamine dehydrogenase